MLHGHAPIIVNDAIDKLRWDEVWTDQHIAASDARISFYGRFNRSDPDQQRFSWSGSQIYIRFNGSSIGATINPATSGPPRFAVLVDGALHHTLAPQQDWTVRWFHAARKDMAVTLAEGLDSGEHSVGLWLLSEPGSPGGHFGSAAGETVFGGLLLREADSLGEAPPMKTRHLRFLGDSDTAGFCCDGTTGIQGDTQLLREGNRLLENNYNTWAGQLTRNLDAMMSTQAISGIGVRDYRTIRPSNSLPDHPLATLMNLTNPGEAAFPWDASLPSTPIPDAVIALIGPNDFVLGRKKASEEGGKFKKAFAGLLRGVAQEYEKLPYEKQPEIISVCGGSGNGFDPCQDIQAAVDAWTANHTHKAKAKVHTVSMSRASWEYINNGPKGDDFQGCASHYNAAGHAVVASEIGPQIAAILGWPGGGSHDWCEADAECAGWCNSNPKKCRGKT